MHHIYSAPNCIRCKIVKGFLKEQGQTWDETDFKEQKEEFNTFYRTNRPSIYRNPEGVEFPIYTDGTTIKQGSGEVIAFLLSEHEMECCVTRSDLLHGWIAGLYPSACPTHLQDKFIKLVDTLSKGGLTVCLRVDGRNPDLLEKLIEMGLVQKLEVNILGPATLYEQEYGSAPTAGELAKTIEIAKKFKDSRIGLQLKPLKDGDSYRYITKEETAEAAKMLSDACGDKQLPYLIVRILGEELNAIGLNDKLEELADADLFKYRSASRDFLFKTDILKV